MSYKQTVHCPNIPYSSQTICGHDTTIFYGLTTSIINLKYLLNFLSCLLLVRLNETKWQRLRQSYCKTIGCYK